MGVERVLPPDGVKPLSRPCPARYAIIGPMSRAVGIGVPAALLVAGIVLAILGAKIVAFALAAIGLVGLVSWAFYEVGRSEDRERERQG